MRTTYLLLPVALAIISCLPAIATAEVPVPLPGGDCVADTLPSYMQPAAHPMVPAQSPTADDMTGATLASVRHTLSLPSIFPSPESTHASHATVITAPGFVGFAPLRGVTVYAAAFTQTHPGLLGTGQGRIGIQHEFGDFTLNVYGSAAHYGYFRGMQTVWGIGGSLDYRINDRVSLTLFGSSSSRAGALTPAMAGYMNVPRFGGYASFDLDEHWGVRVGAQSVRSLVTNRWEAQPIVSPYYKINGQAAIEVDVGGILYNVIKNYSGNGTQRANPTFGPPVGGPPPVAPRPDR